MTNFKFPTPDVPRPRILEQSLQKIDAVILFNQITGIGNVRAKLSFEATWFEAKEITYGDFCKWITAYFEQDQKEFENDEFFYWI